MRLSDLNPNPHIFTTILSAVLHSLLSALQEDLPTTHPCLFHAFVVTSRVFNGLARRKGADMVAPRSRALQEDLPN